MAARKKSAPAPQLEPGALLSAPWPAFIAIAVVLAVTFLVYIPTLRFQFVYDDVEQVVQNPNIQSWNYLSDYFTKHLWSQLGWYQVRFYRPLFLVWLRTNHALFGLNASYWHLTTVAAHLLATLLVYVLVFVLLRSWATAALAALFFGLHPIHVEVAAWISASSEALLAAALMSALACFAKATMTGRMRTARTNNDWRWVAVSLFFYAIALLFKETAMVFPAIIFTFACLWHDGQERAERASTGEWLAGAWFAFTRTLPFVALTAVYLTVRWTVLKSIVTTTLPLGLKTLVLTVPSLLLFYCRLLVWPARLSPFYDTPLVTQPSVANFVVPVVAIILILGISIIIFGGVLRLRSRKTLPASTEPSNREAEWRLSVLACVWMVVFILPPLDLPALQNGVFVQDRYLYLPSVGFSILLALGLSRLGLSSLGRAGRRFAGLPWPQVLAALVLASAMAAGTEAQSKIWASNVGLFTRAVERDPESRIAQHDLAAALVDTRRYDEAIKLLQKLLSEDSNDAVDNNNLGQAYLNLGDREHAEVYLAKACQLHPTPKQLYQLGAVRFNLGRPEAAEQAFEQAIAMDPSGVGYHYALGLAMERSGNLKAAIDAFQKELTVNPGDTKSQQELARLSAQGRQK